MSNCYYSATNLMHNNYYTDKVPLRVNCAGKETNTSAIKADSVRKDYYLFYLAEGELRITSPLRQTLRGGDVIIFDCDIPFSYHSANPPTTHYFVHFTGSDCIRAMKSCNIEPQKVYHMAKPLYGAFEEIFKTILLYDAFFEPDSGAKLMSLFASMGRYERETYAQSENAGKSRIKKSLEYIHRNFTGEIVVSDLAEIENLSESRYRTLFHSITKLSPMEYITALRLSMACELLCSSDTGIEQIAVKSGYRDSHYFSRLFKKKFSCTPTQYKDRYRAEQNGEQNGDGAVFVTK